MGKDVETLKRENSILKTELEEREIELKLAYRTIGRMSAEKAILRSELRQAQTQLVHGEFVVTEEYLAATA